MTRMSRRTLLAAGGAAWLGACAGPERNRLPRDPVIEPGVGQFVIPGGKRHEARRITVHYFRPRAYTSNSPILIVLPGSGRNGDAYRDAWLPFAETKGVFIAAPSYAEKDYDEGAYQMGGVVENLEVGQPQPGSTRSVVYLRDEDIRFDVNPRRDEWLFNDFDRLFHLITRATSSRQKTYDMFGHSAGAQILHRHVLLHPESGADRVVAANAGFYTLPDLDAPLPTGLAGLGVSERTLRHAFSRPLSLLLGENDNDAEKGGIHLHTPIIDRQGNDRLARGRYFHEFSLARAKALKAAFNWDLRVVPGVGHDFRGMTAVAARLLYG